MVKVKLQFRDLRFQKTDSIVRAFFLVNFYFDIDKAEVEKIGPFKVEKGSLIIEGKEAPVRKNFNFLLERKFAQLRSLISMPPHKPAVYAHEGMLPAIGSLYFGLVDRDTNIIEVRPLTCCNLNCIFCSVDQSQRLRDFVAESDWLIKEFRKLAGLKSKVTDNIEAHINAQGEPLLYARLPELVKGIASTENVKTISLDTNGTLLTKKKIDQLVKAGLTRFNISLNAFDPVVATRLAGAPYPFEHIIAMCKYIASKTAVDLLIAPVWLKGVNDKEVEKIIQFVLSLQLKQRVPAIGIQNFLEYRFGKMPVKQVSWDNFYAWLAKLEKKYKTKLILQRKDFGIHSAKVLRKPSKKGQIVDAELVCPGRFPREMLALAQERVITIPSCAKEKGKVRVKITRDKYNVFYGKLV